jgi:2-hydroxy-3-keto-5-methylthiopentenyl-1-phosphate phosphatase
MDVDPGIQYVLDSEEHIDYVSEKTKLFPSLQHMLAIYHAYVWFVVLHSSCLSLVIETIMTRSHPSFVCVHIHRFSNRRSIDDLWLHLLLETHHSSIGSSLFSMSLTLLLSRALVLILAKWVGCVSSRCHTW